MSASPDRRPIVAATLGERVDRVVQDELAPLVRRIDEGHYPEAVLRSLGEAGAFSAHVGQGGSLHAAIDAMARVARECLATGFCIWCQDTFVWYLANSENDGLRRALLPAAAAGSLLGGTGLSNPMKAASGIEPLRLRAERVEGGYVVNGTLPWVSNLGRSHHFGTVFGVDDRQVMALIDCATPGIRLGDGARFLALDGTRTCSVVFRDALVPDSNVLAEDACGFVSRVKAGFILLQTGMGLGVIEGCIDVMRTSDESCGHINRYLEDRPDLFADALDGLRRRIETLARTPYETSREYQREVLAARLETSMWSLRAAQAALLHAGAKGYLAGATAQRKLREASFVAIVTPAVKHLRKEISQLD
jgi:alkylation response protein AidB-like acyl-CoA dehydrogenase